MPLARATKIIAALLIGLFLSVPHAALAQSLFEANDLDQQVIQLYNQGRSLEAIPLALRALTIREKALGPDHPEVAVSLNNLAELYRAQGRYADCFRGNREWEQSEWTSDAEALAAWMRRIECRTGFTQIGRVFAHAREEHSKAKVSALVYVGDACEDTPEVLFGLARDLRMKAFLFQEGENPEVAKIFQEIARLTGGAYCRFDAGAADQLRDLLRAVAAYAAGGQKALSASRNPSAVKLLQQLK